MTLDTNNRIEKLLLNFKKSELNSYILQSDKYSEFFNRSSIFYILSNIKSSPKVAPSWTVLMLRQDFLKGLEVLFTSPYIVIPNFNNFNNPNVQINICKNIILDDAARSNMPTFYFSNIEKNFLVLDSKFTSFINSRIDLDFSKKHKYLQMMDNNKILLNLDILNTKYYQDDTQIELKLTLLHSELLNLQQGSTWFNSSIVKIETDPYYDLATLYSDILLKLPREDYGFNWIMYD